MNPPPVPPFGDPSDLQPEDVAVAGRRGLFGCGGCALLVLAVTVCLVVLLAFAAGAVRNSEVCTQSLAKASASAKVRGLLGTPLRQGWTFTGGITITGGQGSATVTFPISGPKGEATVRAEATMKKGVWIFTILVVTPEKTGKPIDLLAPVSVTYNRPSSFSCMPSKPPLLNTMITSPDFVRSLSRSRIASVEGS